MGLVAALPTELIEVICSLCAESIFGESGNQEYLDHDEFESTLLYSLPLIHPRWTIPGQKALYRYVRLPTADRYNAFQESLAMFPYNGEYVRAIYIDWGHEDFGGPDGYAYKVLGWFHEMEIQQVVRLCPRLELFDPGRKSPAISQEGIAALKSITGIRSIAWRGVDFHKDAPAVVLAHTV